MRISERLIPEISPNRDEPPQPVTLYRLYARGADIHIAISEAVSACIGARPSGRSRWPAGTIKPRDCKNGGKHRFRRVVIIRTHET